MLRALRSLAPRQDGASPQERMLRVLVLLCVLGAVGWGFWANSERRLEEMLLQGLIRDATYELTSAEKKDIAAYLHSLARAYGIRVELAVLAPPATMAAWDGKSILLIVSPRDKRTALELPPLVRRAMDTGTAAQVAAVMQPYYEKGVWRQGVMPALKHVGDTLAVVSR